MKIFRPKRAFTIVVALTTAFVSCKKDLRESTPPNRRRKSHQ